MQGILRYVILFALLMAAFSAYSFGSQTGMFVFILLGFALEGAFWLGLFPIKRNK